MGIPKKVYETICDGDQILDVSNEKITALKDCTVSINEIQIKVKKNKPLCVSFKFMIQDVEYKNINTWNDQRYKRMGNDLYTKSKYTNERWSASSASQTGYYFFLATDGNQPERN